MPLSALWCNTKHNSATFYCSLDNFHTGSSVKRVSNVKWIFMRNEQLVTYCCSNSSFLVNLVPETWYPVHYGEPEEAGSRAKMSRKFAEHNIRISWRLPTDTIFLWNWMLVPNKFLPMVALVCKDLYKDYCRKVSQFQVERQGLKSSCIKVSQ